MYSGRNEVSLDNVNMDISVSCQLERDSVQFPCYAVSATVAEMAQPDRGPQCGK